ncbi:MAG: LuxR C-terminal-related transcriptional regulator [Candidatus Sericytochromatia bacterium]
MMNYFYKNNILYSKIENPHLIEGLNRKRLDNLLDNYINKKLVFISAPASFGKTTFINHWINNNNKNVAFYLLDENDNNLILFIKYLVISIQKNINQNFGQDVLELVEKNFNLDEAITLFINNFLIYPNNYLIFIDNYENITDKNILKVVNWIIYNSPKNVTFIICSRNKDNLLDLDRFRAKNELIELYEKDLSFNLEEIKNLFRENNIEVRTTVLEKIYNKSEGWILSLQLLIKLINNDDNLDFLDNLDNKNLFDYIFNQILSKIQNQELIFLLKTSLIPCFSNALANKILNIKNSFEIIKELEKNNLFIINLDNKGFLYRYHNLFADILKRQFECLFNKEEEIIIRNIAIDWYLENNLYFYALNQAFILQKEGLVLEILNKLLENKDFSIDQNTLTYINKIPLDKLIKYQKIFFFYIHNIIENYDSNKMELVEKFIADNIKLINNKELEPYLLFIKYNHLHITDQYKEAEKYINKCLELSKKNQNTFMINVCITSLGLIYSKKLNNKNSIEIINKQLQYFKDNIHISLKINSNLLYSLLGANLIEEAKNKALYILENIEKIRFSYNYINIKLNTLVTLLHIYFYTNDEKNLLITLEELKSYIPLTSNERLIYLIYTNIINVLTNLGKLEEADFFINSMYDNYDFLKKDSYFLKMRCFLYKDKNKALKIYNKLKINEDYIEPNYLFIIINLYISFSYLELANKVIDNFFKEHSEKDSLYSIILYIFKAVVLYKENNLKNKNKYLEYLEKAILLSEKSKTVNLFTIFTPDINQIIYNIFYEINIENKNIINQKLPIDYLRSILVLLYKKNLIYLEKNTIGLDITFTKREKELLDILSYNLSNQEITERLNISINTLKTHIKKIYSKLGVNNRKDAIIKYQSLIN